MTAIEYPIDTPFTERQQMYVDALKIQIADLESQYKLKKDTLELAIDVIRQFEGVIETAPKPPNAIGFRELILSGLGIDAKFIPWLCKELNGGDVRNITKIQQNPNENWFYKLYDKSGQYAIYIRMGITYWVYTNFNTNGVTFWTENNELIWQ